MYQQLYTAMARTKASVGAKVASGKSSKARCSVAAPPSNSVASGSSDRSSKSYSGGNSVCPRETPKWQKPITNFFISKETDRRSEEPGGDGDSDEETATTSKPKPKRNIIESDEEEEETPKNRELDETINLEPLTGENSHKLDEYYPKNGVKGKGVGKKTKGKENVDCNVRKRDLDVEDIVEEQVSKKVKVC